MRPSIAFIDPHLHADGRSVEEFVRLAAAGCQGVLALAGSSGGFRSPDSLLDYFRKLARVDRARIERAGLKVWLGLGIHPGGIPESGLDACLQAWPEVLVEHRAAAVGEVGLQTGSEVEIRILARAFEVAVQCDLPLVLHTPRDDKTRLLELSLDLLARSKLSPARVLADHLDAGVLRLARSAGCWLGLSVHPAKLTPAAAAAIVAGQGPERIVLDSDLGAEPGWLFALPAAISALGAAGLPDGSISAVVRENATAWLGVDR